MGTPCGAPTPLSRRLFPHLKQVDFSVATRSGSATETQLFFRIKRLRNRFSPDGRHVATSNTTKCIDEADDSSSSDSEKSLGQILVLDAATGRRTAGMNGRPGAWDIAYSPDGSTLVLRLPLPPFREDLLVELTAAPPTGGTAAR